LSERSGVDSVHLYSAEGEEVDPSRIFFVASCYESSIWDLLLNVQDGEVIEEMTKYQTVGAYGVESYFDDLKEAYRNLKLIPCLRRSTIEAWDAKERADATGEDEVRAQTEEWGTDLDV
jgi:hypothetical protein